MSGSLIKMALTNNLCHSCRKSTLPQAAFPHSLLSDQAGRALAENKESTPVSSNKLAEQSKIA
jgi:hypothetical protein